MAFALVTGRSPALPAPEISTLTLVWPQFHTGAMIGIAVPLYLVTMASQNLPGFAVLRASGYEPPTSACLRITGLFSLLSAPSVHQPRTLQPFRQPFAPIPMRIPTTANAG